MRAAKLQQQKLALYQILGLMAVSDPEHVLVGHVVMAVIVLHGAIHLTDAQANTSLNRRAKIDTQCINTT